MTAGKLHRTIPIFMPEMACPFRCIYCNQQVITGRSNLPSEEDIIGKIESFLSTIPKGAKVELGFFGGTFTGIALDEQERMLKVVQPYIEDGRIESIRLSTRPDYINDEILALLSHYHVGTVELGVQSFDDEVLEMSRRGYDSASVAEAAIKICLSGIELGMQMMIGLPGDTQEKSVDTAKRIISSGATNTRIYPTLVVKNTHLAQLYKEGKYKPLTLDEAVTQAKTIMPLFENAGVTVLRVGLHPTDGFINGNDYLAGPFHVSFRELVETEIWHDIFLHHLQVSGVKSCRNRAIVKTAPEMIASAVGYGRKNKILLSEWFNHVSFYPDPEMKGHQYRIIVQ